MPVLIRALADWTRTIAVGIRRTVGVASAVGTAALTVVTSAHAQTSTQSSQPSATAAAPMRLATYIYLRGSDTLGVETLTVADSAVSGDLVFAGAPRIMWSHALVANGTGGMTFGTLTMRVFAPGTAVNSAPVQEGTLRIVGDSARLEFSAGTRTQKQTLPTSRGAIALVNASVLHAAVVGARAVAAGTPTVQFFLSNGGQTAPGTFTRRGDTLAMTLAGSESFVTFDADGLPREIRIPSQSARVVRGAAGTVVGTPPLDYRAPSGAPYTAEQLLIPTGRGYTLAATLTRPIGSKRVPVAITISGSGPQERDSRISVVAGYAIFREIADTLGRRGIATLRFDDRGVGASGGLESARTATSADFADDVRSIVTYLRARSDIDGAQIALIGHSEGGMIAPMVAADTRAVRAIVLLAGSGYSGRRIIMAQNRESLDAAPLTPAQRDSIWKTVPSQLDSTARVNPWLRYFMAHDPVMTARRVPQPVLILQGETDHQITPEQADTLAVAFRAGGNRAVAVRRFADTNHLFLHDTSGSFAGYASLKDVGVNREVLGTLADWLVATLR